MMIPTNIAYKNNRFAQLIPILAVALATIPLVGCGGGGNIASLPTVPDVPNRGTEPGTPAPAPTPAAPIVTAPDAAIEAAAENAINQARLTNGVPALRHSATLQQIAETYSKKMATEGFFSHSDPD